MDKTTNPWKILGSRTVYQNPWISVREDRVIRPDGNPGIYGVVETRIATGVVALTPENQIYLVGQFRYPTNEYSWEIIEGGTDGNEDPLSAAKRELREEAGLVATEWSLLGGEIHTSNCFCAERGLVYLARGLSEVERAPDGTEILQLKKLSLDAALAMVQEGEIKDAISIIGIYRAANL